MLGEETHPTETLMEVTEETEREVLLPHEEEELTVINEETNNKSCTDSVIETVVDETALLCVEEVPVYAREIAIATGYRSCLDYPGCIRSIFRLHNETVNIWSHLTGFFFFLAILLDNIFRVQPHNRNLADLLGTTFQLISYQICMGSSALFHTFLCRSKTTKEVWQRADHAGILVALVGTYVRIIVTNFSCFPIFQLGHLTAVLTIFLTVAMAKYGRYLFISHPLPHEHYKVGLPLFLGLSSYAVAPFSHWILLSPILQQNHVTNAMVAWMFFPYMIGAVGVIFYVSRFPEKMVPSGCVDLCGASHQIWHLFIMTAMASWYFMFNWVSVTRPPVCQLVQEKEVEGELDPCLGVPLCHPALLHTSLNLSFAHLDIMPF